MCSSDGVKSECCPKGEVRPLLCAGLMRSRLLCTPAGLELKKKLFLTSPCPPESCCCPQGTQLGSHTHLDPLAHTLAHLFILQWHSVTLPGPRTAPAPPAGKPNTPQERNGMSIFWITAFPPAPERSGCILLDQILRAHSKMLFYSFHTLIYQFYLPQESQIFGEPTILFSPNSVGLAPPA